LISHRFEIDRAPEAYELITGKAKEPCLGVLLTYPNRGNGQLTRRIENPEAKSSSPLSDLTLGVLGAGNYAQAVFLPVVEKTGRVNRVAIASAAGLTARHASQKYHFQYASSSDMEVINDPAIHLLVVLTRHNLHARQVLAGLRLGKHVFCEKPLALNAVELSEIRSVLAEANAPQLMVGFNRRFAPFASRLKEFFQDAGEPMAIHYRVNAGYIPANHWVHNPEVGGGRIIGEGCHFVDFLTYLVGQVPQSISALALPNSGRYCQDNVVLSLAFPNGSIGTIAYLANGDKSVAKERVEVFCGGQVGILDDFRTLELVRDGRRKTFSSPLGQDKGHQAGWVAFLNCVEQGLPAPIPFEQIAGIHQAVFAAAQALAAGTIAPVTIEA
jgi:predicted dehydrogenase